MFIVSLPFSRAHAAFPRAIHVSGAGPNEFLMILMNALGGGHFAGAYLTARFGSPMFARPRAGDDDRQESAFERHDGMEA
jgi:hypothetical protein